jgi:hypothetical protein
VTAAAVFVRFRHAANGALILGAGTGTAPSTGYRSPVRSFGSSPKTRARNVDRVLRLAVKANWEPRPARVWVA